MDGATVPFSDLGAKFMETDQLTPNRAAWQTTGFLGRNGTGSPCAANEQRADAAAAAHRTAWQQAIERTLAEWGRDPSQLDEEGTVTPSRETIQLAIDLAALMSKAVLPAPTRIVPDAEGGIVFERQEKGVFESIRISADGSIEHRVFENCRLVFREPWSPFGVNRGIC